MLVLVCLILMQSASRKKESIHIVHEQFDDKISHGGHFLQILWTLRIAPHVRHAAATGEYGFLVKGVGFVVQWGRGQGGIGVAQNLGDFGNGDGVSPSLDAFSGEVIFLSFVGYKEFVQNGWEVTCWIPSTMCL